MPGCRIEKDTEGGRTVIRVSGVFDSASAYELWDRLAREPEQDVILDFSLVREFADMGVATLARGLAARGRPPRLRGLRQHQLRICRYCGLDVEALQPPASG